MNSLQIATSNTGAAWNGSDPRQTDDDFINSRAEAAAEEFELAGREGISVDASQERAIAVLMDGIE